MAYYSQERKKQIQPTIKELLKEYGLKGSLSVRNSSAVVLTIQSGVLDFIGNHCSTVNKRDNHDYQRSDLLSLQINPHWYQDCFTGKQREFLQKAFGLLNKGNHDNSDVQTDYFDVGWYVDVNIGRWDKPYELIK